MPKIYLVYSMIYMTAGYELLAKYLQSPEKSFIRESADIKVEL
jgi:hypothetical protein